MTDIIEENFIKFHKQNPNVYKLFDWFARQMIDRGRKTLSASLIVERIRWELALETTSETDNTEIKINNNYRSRYSRLWMERNPEFAGVFRTRALWTDSIDHTDFEDQT